VEGASLGGAFCFPVRKKKPKRKAKRKRKSASGVTDAAGSLGKASDLYAVLVLEQRNPTELKKKKQKKKFKEPKRRRLKLVLDLLVKAFSHGDEWGMQLNLVRGSIPKKSPTAILALTPIAYDVMILQLFLGQSNHE